MRTYAAIRQYHVFAGWNAILEMKFQGLVKGFGGALAAVIVLLIAGVAMYLGSGGSGAASQTRSVVFIDAETGVPFSATLSAGQTLPLRSPDTGRDTGVPAELCYWTPDGKPKSTPDPVLLNPMHMPPLTGPTFCPVCHRLVVEHNPRADTTAPPPPTEVEYNAARPAGGHGPTSHEN